MSLNDLRDYRAIVHENNYVIKLDNVHRMYVPPPPSSGILVAFIMKLMKGGKFVCLEFKITQNKSKNKNKKAST